MQIYLLMYVHAEFKRKINFYFVMLEHRKVVLNKGLQVMSDALSHKYTRKHIYFQLKSLSYGRRCMT